MAKKTKTKYLKRGIRRTLILILSVIVLVCGWEVGCFLIDDYGERKAVSKVDDLIAEAVSEQQEQGQEGEDSGDAGFAFSKQAWNELYAMNPDFIGYMAFDDRFVTEPIVQGQDNVYYLKHWVDGSYASSGTLFIDATNNLDSTNLTIYGHHVFYNNSKLTPMVALKNQEDYDKHHEFKIWYKDHVSYYVVTHVYYFNINEDFEYSQADFYTDEEWTAYLNEINRRNLITPADTLEKGDKFLSLQTCVNVNGPKRQIFTCKEVASFDYE